MPRETIFTPYAHDPAEGNLPFQMQVGWERDRDVQVGIASHDDRHLVDYIYADQAEAIGAQLQEFLREIGRDITDEHMDSTNEAHDIEFDNHLLGRLVLDSVTSSTVFGTSVWWHPGRSQINELIKLLRKARDAAFGRDE